MSQATPATLRIFVMMPFDTSFDDVYSLIQRVVAQVNADVTVRRLDEVLNAGSITDDLIAEIESAALCIADLTGANPNVMWEVGYAAAKLKPVIGLCQKGDRLPFDIHDVRTLFYERSSLARSLEPSLIAAVRQSVARIELQRALPARTVQFMTRDEQLRLLPGISERFDAAQQEVRFSGNDCAAMVIENGPVIRRALKRGVAVKVMAADPSALGMDRMLHLIDPRFPKPGEFERSMAHISVDLLEMSEHFPNFEYRLLPVLPALGFFMVDPLTGGLVKVEFYVPSPWHPIPSRPHLTISPGMGEWRD